MADSDARQALYDYATVAFRETGVPPVVHAHLTRLLDAHEASALTPTTHAFRVTEIRDNTVRRVHGYHTTLEGAFAYCEAQERTPSTIPSARFELLPDPSGKRWLVLSYYKPDDPCPEISDLIITRVDIHADEPPHAS